MQDISGTSLQDSWNRMQPSCVRFWVKWDGVNWVDEGDYVVRIEGDHEAVESGSGTIGVGGAIANRFSVNLDNSSDRFTSWYPAGPLYTYIADGAWRGIDVCVEIGYESTAGVKEYRAVIKGYLDGWTEAAVSGETVLGILDPAGRMVDFLGRSPLYYNYRSDQLVEAFLELLPAAHRPILQADPGIFSFEWGWIDDEPIWGELSLIAQAEGGRLYFSHAGDRTVKPTLRFEGAGHFLQAEHRTPLCTLSINDLSEHVTSYKFLDYANHVEVYYTPSRLGNYRELWRCNERRTRLRPAESKTFRALFNSPAYSIQAPYRDVDYIAVTAGGTKRSQDVAVAVTSYGGQADVAVTNNGASDLFLARLRLIGRPVLFGDQMKVEVEDAGALADRAGKITLAIQDNPYVQAESHARALAQVLLERTKAPRMEIQISDVDGMSWLEPGDLIRLTSYPPGIAIEGFVNGIHHVWSKDGYGMTLRLMRSSDLYPYDDIFIMGEHELGVAAANRGRFFV